MNQHERPDESAMTGGERETGLVPGPSVQLIIDLFESSPNVMLFVKSPQGRYLAVSDLFVRRMGCGNRSELLGRTVEDLFPPDVARGYRAEDEALLQSGLTRRNRLEIIVDADGRQEWFLTTRTLHHDPGFEQVIVAVSTPVDLGTRSLALGSGLLAAIELAEANREERLRVSDLAEAAGLSTDQLERVMRRVLGVSPKQYLMAIRLQRAANLLVTTTLSLSEIALACRYYDQSQFTRYFKGAYGVTPGQYRSASRTLARPEIRSRLQPPLSEQNSIEDA